MSYKDEWILLETADDIDEIEHREPIEEFLFYQAVAEGDIDKVRQNCKQDRFVEEKGGRGAFQRSGNESEISFCYYNSHDRTDVQTERDGDRAGVSLK